MKILHPCSEAEYRRLPRISNSDLSIFADEQMGRRRPLPLAAFAAGRYLHALLLESQAVAAALSNVDMTSSTRRTIESMVSRFEAHSDLRRLLNNSAHELACIFPDAASGLPCKARLDILPPCGPVYDLKMTRLTRESDFLEVMPTYGYDRQAAFYADASQRSSFVFIALCNRAPYDIMVIECPPRLLEQGRRRRDFLLSEWQRTKRPLPNQASAAAPCLHP